jgi:hypothetical protein
MQEGGEEVVLLSTLDTCRAKEGRAGAGTERRTEGREAGKEEGREEGREGARGAEGGATRGEVLREP